MILIICQVHHPKNLEKRIPIFKEIYTNLSGDFPSFIKKNLPMNIYFKINAQAQDRSFLTDLEFLITKYFGPKFQKLYFQNESSQIQLLGPIGLPKTSKNQTLLRAHHIHKKSRDQFQMTKHSSFQILKAQTDVKLSLAHQKLLINLFKVISQLKNEPLTLKITQKESFLKKPKN